jgi:hypothetical protein
VLYYPKIPGSSAALDGRCIAFEKYDGTNLHWDWDRDFGWHAFGTRRDSFNTTGAGVAEFVERHAHLAEAPGLFHDTLATGLEQIVDAEPRYAAAQSIRVFAEFLGPNSFAGLHKADEPKELRLFDVAVVANEHDAPAMVSPTEFTTNFAGLSIARVVYEGKLTGKFAEEVRQGEYGVAEGVICKGVARSGEAWMVKIKTYAYLERLKQAFAERWEDYWE